MLKREDIQIRDPFILVDDNNYYLFGTTDKMCWGKGTSFHCYKSSDLENYEGPFESFIPKENFWADLNFWAPEVFKYKGNYYMFASFKKEGICRGTQILISKYPEGPYEPISDRPVTPDNCECLDGTLWVEDGKPYMIYCHEWVQIHDGRICAIELSEDLSKAVDDSKVLLIASEANWTRGFKKDDNPEVMNYITDGPFIYENSNGNLVMLWSSNGEHGYAIGQAISENGIKGPWNHVDTPLFGKDGGHGMIFKALDGRLLLTIHSPNDTPNERPIFLDIIEKDGLLEVK